MSGTLFVVATPIGNLEDVTLRALRVLQTVDLIAAEDTRRTARLLAHHGISTPTLSFHQHNTRARIPHLIDRIQRGESIAIVTDAGTPGISDPGLELVQASIAAGVPIDPIPGVSAPMTAAIASGFPLVPLTILGFVPTRAKDRSAWLDTLASIQSTVTFFETPHRINQTLAELGSILGDRPIMVGREMTKVHQEFLRGSAREISSTIHAARGEYTIVIGPALPAESRTTAPDESAIFADFCHSTEIMGTQRRTAINAIAKRHNLSARSVYQIVEKQKHMSDDQ